MEAAYNPWKWYLVVVCMASAASCPLVPTTVNLPLHLLSHGYGRGYCRFLNGSNYVCVGYIGLLRNCSSGFAHCSIDPLFKKLMIYVYRQVV